MLREPAPTPRQSLVSLEERCALALLVSANLEVLAALDGVHVRELAGCALQAEDDLLCRLCLLVEHRLCLSAVATLLAVIAALAWGGERGVRRVRRLITGAQGLGLIATAARLPPKSASLPLPSPGLQTASLATAV